MSTFDLFDIKDIDIRSQNLHQIDFNIGTRFSLSLVCLALLGAQICGRGPIFKPLPGRSELFYADSSRDIMVLETKYRDFFVCTIFPRYWSHHVRRNCKPLNEYCAANTNPAGTEHTWKGQLRSAFHLCPCPLALYLSPTADVARVATT